MADTFGNVTKLATTSEVLLYTCPIASTATKDVASVEDVFPYAQQPITQTQITGFVLNSWSTGTNGYIYLTPSTDSPTTEGTPSDYGIFGPTSTPANSTTVFNPGLVLAPGNSIWIEAGAADKLTITMSYIEIT